MKKYPSKGENNSFLTFAERIQEQIDTKREKFVANLKEFVQQKSISTESDSCNNMADLIIIHLQKLKSHENIQTKFFNFHKYGEICGTNPIITGLLSTTEAVKKPTLLFMGHMDTQPVNVENWTKKPFEGQIIEEKLYGRGALDTKAQIVALLSALEILIELNIPFLEKINIKFFFNSDEEIGSEAHSIPLSVKHPEILYTDAAINCENTNERIVLGCKGLMMLKFSSCLANAMHSGKTMFITNHPVFELMQALSGIREGNHLKIAALTNLNPSVGLLNQETEEIMAPNRIYIPKAALIKAYPYILSEQSDAILLSIAEEYAGISFNINSFHAGSLSPKTSVPAQAEAFVDMRLPPKISPLKIEQILTTYIENHPSVQMELIKPNPEYPEYFSKFEGCYTSITHPFVQLFKTVLETYQIPRIISPFSSGTSDERLLDPNIPHIKYGCTGKHNHAGDEYVELSSFYRTIAVYALMILNFAQNQEST